MIASWLVSEDMDLCYRVITAIDADPELERKLQTMYERFGDDGLRHALNAHVKITSTKVIVESGGTATINVGCHINSEEKERSSRKTSRSISSEWRTSEKTYFGDKWVTVFKACKDASEAYQVSSQSGLTEVRLTKSKASARAGFSNGLDRAAYWSPDEVEGAVQTSQLKFGQGPAGWLLLPSAVKSHAEKQGLILTSPGGTSTTSQRELQSEPEAEAASEAVPSAFDFSGIDISF